ncbi:ATP-binding response regulator [Chitinophaga skermanii]|nr:hybrid sensor histidine kinase/response regulator [Chitinophaga skermanii]
MKKQVKILMIDDDEDDYFLVQTLLQDLRGQEYIVDWAPTYNKALAIIAQKEHELYLVDYRLGAHTGIDVLEYFKSIDYRAPVIMLTGKGDYLIDQAAASAGAADYLVKGEFTGLTLERAIRYAINEWHHLQKIEESQRKYFGIFERSHDIIILADCDYRIIDVNPSALKRLQYTKEELLEMDLPQLFYLPNEGQLFVEHMCEGDNNLNQKAYSFTTSHQQKLDVLLNASLLDEKNHVYLLVAEDVTDKNRKDQERRQQDKFAVTGRIARIIAHEVRNPLTNILLAVSQFRQDPPPDEDEADAYLGIVERNCERINQLITELLQTTRLPELDMQAHPINNLLQNALEQAADRLQLAGIKVETSFLPHNAVVEADKDKILIAFLNLIINAIEAMEGQNGLLRIEMDETSKYINIHIIDNGCGISEEGRARLFDPFFTSKKKGNGLGLTSTQTIILSHKGNIFVESEVGTGSTFTIILPKLY